MFVGKFYRICVVFDVHGTVHHYCILLSITNKMQCYTVLFITVNALHVSGGFSAHHQELKTVNTASGYAKLACLLLSLAEYCITLHLVGYT